MLKKPLGKLKVRAFGTLEIPRLEQAILDGFAALEDLTGTVSDAMDQLGVAGTVPGSVLIARLPGARIVGQALTVLNRKRKGTVRAAVARNRSGLADIEAHNLAEPGDVLVVQGVAEVSSMGGVMATIGKRQGESGAIVDGAVRDVAHARAIGYPVWSAALSPATGKWRLETVSVNKPVTIRGLRVRPGDLVIADEVGVCFVPFGRAAQVLEEARRLAKAEAERLQKLASGISLAEYSALPRKG